MDKQRLKPDELSPATAWQDILDANINWGNPEQTGRVHTIASAKLANTIVDAGKTADTLNKRIYWLTIFMAVLAVAQLILAAVQCWPIVVQWIKK